jgi:hypothetical protein
MRWGASVSRLRIGLRTGVLLAIAAFGIAWALVLVSGSLARADSLSSVISGFAAVLFGLPPLVSWYRDSKKTPDAVAGQSSKPAAHPPDTAGTSRRSSRHPPTASIPAEPAFVGRNLTVRGSRNVIGHHNTVGFGPRAFLGTIIVIMLGAAGIVFVSSRTVPTAPDSLRDGAYLAEVRGSVQDSAFDREGALRVRPGHDGLPYQWCLEVGNPWATSAAGTIWFGTNGTCFGSGRDAALTDMQTNGSTTRIHPNVTDLPLNENPNAFAAPAGSNPSVYIPESGDVSFTVSGSTLTGEINLSGPPGTGSGAQGQITMALSARLVSTDPDAIISIPSDSPDSTPPASGPSRSQAVEGTRFTVKSIDALDQTAGSTAFMDSERERINNADLTVQERLGGSFVWAPANSRADLFPLIGQVNGSAPIFELTGQAKANAGTLVETTVKIHGFLNLSGDEPRLTLDETVISQRKAFSYEALLTLAQHGS